MIKKNKPSDRRAYPRLYAYHLAKYRLISSKDARHPILAAIRDIGGQGVCIQVEELIPVSSVIQLYINFPQFPQPIPCLARVVWIKKIGRENRYEAGLQFIDIDSIFRQVIIERVESVHKTSGEKVVKKLAAVS